MIIEIAPGVTQTEEDITNSTVFRQWADSVGGDAWPGTITIVDVDEWGGRIQLLVVLLHRFGAAWPLRVILRSPTVDVQIQLSDGRSEPYLLFVRQPRDAVGLDLLSNVAGGIDPDESPAEAALREASEETGLPRELLQKGHLVPLAPQPLIVSPGITNEVSYFYLLSLTVTSAELPELLQQFQAGPAGLAEEGESTQVVALHQSRAYQAVMTGGTDLKALTSLVLANIPRPH